MQRAHVVRMTHFELQFPATSIGLRDVWRVQYTLSHSVLTTSGIICVALFVVSIVDFIHLPDYKMR